MGKNTIQNDGPFVACYNMRAVRFVLPDEMADVSIAGLQRFILIRRLNHTGSHRPFQTPFTSRKKNIQDLEQESPICCNHTNYEESSRSSLILVASYDMP